MKNQYLYFAYGSNMNPARIAERLPNAILVGPAKLKNYAVVERLYADIDQEQNSEVHGVLYFLTRDEVNTLDIFEGYPSIYTRVIVSVDFNGNTLHAFTYEMTPATKLTRHNRPYPETYRQLCSAGAQFHHIKNSFTKGQKNMKKTIRIAVYGTLLKGESNSGLSRAAIKCTPCHLKGTLFDTGYGFPTFEPKGEQQVEAELLEVDEATFARIERLEGYPTLYTRKRQRVVLQDGTVVMPWVYIMNTRPVEASIIPSGSWRNRD